jgi:hypothetical protein
MRVFIPVGDVGLDSFVDELSNPQPQRTFVRSKQAVDVQIVRGQRRAFGVPVSTVPIRNVLCR